jgi:hypothetical protein
MKRNHGRINQTSLDMLVSWRGNCDVQLLIYESDPEHPDVKEISRVTDYVVSYSCKGNTTRKEEKEMTKSILLGADDSESGAFDLKRVCKQVMNKAATRRLISKQEASVMLADLPLSHCSECIETVSISNNRKITVEKDSSKGTKKLIKAYADRDKRFHHLSLHEYFFVHREQLMKKRPAIPHYVGSNGYPIFPVTQAYCRHVLLVYKPWTIYPEKREWKKEFQVFINTKDCPKSARLTYDRVMQRHYMGTKFVDPKAAQVDNTKNKMSEEDEIALLLTGMGAQDLDQNNMDAIKKINRGHDHDWGKPPMVS